MGEESRVRRHMNGVRSRIQLKCLPSSPTAHWRDVCLHHCPIESSSRAGEGWDPSLSLQSQHRAQQRAGVQEAERRQPHLLQNPLRHRDDATFREKQKTFIAPLQCTVYQLGNGTNFRALPRSAAQKFWEPGPQALNQRVGKKWNPIKFWI